MKIIGYNCGKSCRERFNSMGLKLNQEVEIICEEPYGGPYVLQVGRFQVALGKGMFSKLIFEE